MDQSPRERLEAMEFAALKKLHFASGTLRFFVGFCYVFAAVSVCSALIGLFKGAGRNEILLDAGTMLVYLVTAYGLQRRTKWVSVPYLLLCFLLLFAFPLGTLWGGLGFYAMFHAGPLFNDHRLVYRDIVEVYKARKGASGLA